VIRRSRFDGRGGGKEGVRGTGNARTQIARGTPGVVGQSMAAGFCALNGGCIAALAWELYGFTGFLFLEGVCVNVNFSFFLLALV